MEKYIILKAGSAQSLAELVNKAIESGYTVNGSPFSVWCSGWFQSMVAKESNVVREKDVVSVTNRTNGFRTKN